MNLFEEIPYIDDGYIVLHKMEEKDAPTLKSMAENEAVTRYLPTFLFENKFTDKKEAIRQMYGQLFKNKESLLLGVYLKSDPDKMVGVGEYYNYEPNWNKASVGIRIDQPFWHMGIAGHAIAALKKYLFDKTDVKRVTAHVMTENIYSRKAIQEAGFRLRKNNCEEDWGMTAPARVDKFVCEKLGNIGYAKIGNGPKTMVILPGIALKSTLGSADLVASAYGEIFKDYTMYLFDDRSNIDREYSIRERAGDVAAEMKTLHLKNAFVFGASMGGMEAQYLAIDHPDLVGKMVITSSASWINYKAREVLSRWRDIALRGDIKELIHESIYEIYSAATIEKYEDVITKAIGYANKKELNDFIILLEAILRFDCRDELEKIQCPVLVTGAEGDRVLFPESVKYMASALKCGIFIYGNEYGHAVYDEAPDHKQRILEFFERK